VIKLLTDLYRFHFKDEARERLFLASVAFVVTFGIVRIITYLIRSGVGPFHNITTSGGLHIHHLVWGILILLVVGYVWLVEKAVGSSWLASFTAIAYGIGAALDARAWTRSSSSLHCSRSASGDTLFFGRWRAS